MDGRSVRPRGAPIARIQAHFFGRRSKARWIGRAQCTEATCPMVESLALDVWSEQGGRGFRSTSS